MTEEVTREEISGTLRGDPTQGFIVEQTKRTHAGGYAERWFIVAPSGFYRAASGEIMRDGTPSPEWGDRDKVYLFSSHRAAAREANKCHKTTISFTEKWGGLSETCKQRPLGSRTSRKEKQLSERIL